MTPGSTTLEDRLTHALRERADAMPADHARLDEPVSVRRRPRRHAVLAVAAAAAALVVVLVAVGVLLRPAGTRRDATSTDTVPASTTTTLPPVPAGVAGSEVPLQRADNEDTQHLVMMQLRQDPASHPVAVQTPGEAPIVATGACMMIADAPANGTGYQGSCSSSPATSIVGAIDTGANVTPTSKVYGAWLGLPPGTAYVTYTYGDQHQWQRPLDGVSYFVQHGPAPALGGEPLILRAFDASGSQLGEARAQPIRLADGSWDWF